MTRDLLVLLDYQGTQDLTEHRELVVRQERQEILERPGSLEHQDQQAHLEHLELLDLLVHRD